MDLFAENPDIFCGIKALVVGDIAFDRAWQCCRPQVDSHATHGNQTIFDIEPGGVTRRVPVSIYCWAKIFAIGGRRP